ncbi:MAG: ammonium transporter [Deltaproteobacteria bacterium]|nr:ammonium transporter [Deltaproteobacteria bacterium]
MLRLQRVTARWTVWNQFVVQVTGMVATIVIAVGGTCVICFVVAKTVGFRIDEQMKIEDLDQSLHVEHGYGLIH